MGFTDVVTLLLSGTCCCKCSLANQCCAAGARATMRFDGKTALHRACEAGQEESAKLLIQSLSTHDQIMVQSDAGLTAFEVARQQDMGGIARRLEAFVQQHLASSVVVYHS